MKRTTINFLAALVMVFGATAAFGQTTDTDTATASANILAGIDIAWAADLDFGDIISPGAAETVTVDPNGGTRSASDPAILAGTGGTLARFDVTGAADYVFDITVDPTATLSDGTNNMTATLSWACNDNTSNVDPANCTLVGGDEVLWVGGTLAVNASQPAGAYSGDFDVTVTYQ